MKAAERINEVASTFVAEAVEIMQVDPEIASILAPDCASIDCVRSSFMKTVTPSIVVNPHLSIHDKFYSFTSCSRTSTTPSIVVNSHRAFLRSTNCKMTSARGRGAIVYCLNSGSDDSLAGRHNGKGEPVPH
ncbi:hypothetical protein TNCV_2847291 [Trichonephila clavipes]|nr:hypothetical protein TNCV_2847291 [Trichonephila clavipes]